MNIDQMVDQGMVTDDILLSRMDLMKQLHDVQSSNNRDVVQKAKAMFFKVDFAKAYDSIRWDFMNDVLNSFVFGSKWRSWIRGSLCSGKASILVNGSPTAEFQFHRGLKQGDPSAPFLVILVMESLHLSFSRAVETGIFTGIKID
nr:RNA-directed DNA polymerase, eukaryota, reverse transcriptase zinc-binding domain protein [Tanacetum cinerariifolium]